MAHYNPEKLIVLANASENKAMLSSINEVTLASYEQIYMLRKHFDDTAAIQYLEEIASDGGDQLRSEGRKKYYMALAACGALLSYLGGEDNARLQNVCIKCVTPDMHMMIDYSSLQTLELLQTCKYSIQQNASAKSASLLSTMNYTVTSSGQKFLKSSIVQPLKDIQTIRARQNAVKEILASEDLFSALSAFLDSYPKDHESVCLQMIPKQWTPKDKTKWISQVISRLFKLRRILASLPSLKHALQKSSSLLLRAIFTAVDSESFDQILKALNEILVEEDVKQHQVQNNITSQIFALKCSENSLLDIARKDFCHTTEQIHNLADDYRKSYNLNTIRLLYSSKKNFYLSIAKRSGDHGTNEVQIPDAFISLGPSSNNRHFSTQDLNILNSRLQTSLDDCYEILGNVFQNINDKIQTQTGQLRVLVEAISLLDFILCLVKYAKDCGPLCTCPEVEDAGAMLIVDGRHPVLAHCNPEFNSNSTFLSSNRSVEVICGPNMSGKSTYSRQVALIAILAQMGSFVPASYARLPILSAIYSRCTIINDSGCIEDNVSSFFMEMQDTARIMDSLQASSLVIIDEIGRSTSEEDGEAIAWSIAEYILSKNVFSIFISHYDLIKKLPLMYPKSLCRAYSYNKDTNTHKLEEITPSSHCSDQHRLQYGIDLAAQIGFPEDIIEFSRMLSGNEAEEKSDLNRVSNDPEYGSMIKLYDRLQIISLLAKQSKLSEDTLRSELQSIQSELKNYEHKIQLN